MGKRKSNVAIVLGIILSLIAVGATVFFGMFFIGEGWRDFINNGLPMELWPTLALVVVATVGAIWSFFDRRAGGWILVIGGAGLAVAMLVRGGLADWDAAAIYGLPYLVPGLGLVIIGK
jgi:hypothetical protein